MPALSAFRLRLSVLLLLTSAATAVHAATVRAYIQPEHAQVGQVVNYVISVQNGTVGSLPQLRLPAQIGMNSGVSTSQNIEIRGNQRVFSTQLAWGVAGNEPGEFVIPPQEVLVNGEVLKTNEVRFVVTAQADAPQQAGAENASTPLFQIEVGKTEIYQGEVVPISASLYVPRSVMLRRVGLIDVSKNDFAIARFPQQADQGETVINGVGYLVITYRSTLSALHAGDLKVGPAKCELLFEVYDESDGRMRRSLPFGLMMNAGEPRKQVVKSQEVRVKVLPLPAEGKPTGFNGAVGDFTMNATATPAELTVGDPLAVDVTIEGTGNFEALSAPALTPPDGWKAYPPRRYNVDGPVDPNLTPTSHRRIGYAMVFVPEKSHQELPPFELSYFSPTQKKYITVRTAPISLQIKPGSTPMLADVASGAVGAASPKPMAAQEPKPAISDILMTLPARPHWLSRVVGVQHVPLLRSTTFWAAQAVPATLVLGAMLLAWYRRKQQENASGLGGELRRLWRGLEERGLSDRDFLQRAAHFIQRSHDGGEITDERLRQILHRYETESFTTAQQHATPLSATERSGILNLLAPLLRSMALLIGLFAASGSLLLAAEEPADKVYDQARQALEQGKFTQAQYLAESLTKRHPPALSAANFMLIGHARYRQDDMGRAVLWYQRAQLLNPDNPELRQNLRHLHEKLGFFRYEENSPWVELSLRLRRDTWIITASLGVWLILLAGAACALFGKSPRKICTTVFVTIGLLLFIPSAIFAAVRPSAEGRVADIVVVTAKDVSAYTAATLTSGSVVSIPSGSQARLLEKRGAWSYVEVPTEGETVRGWIETPTYTPLWPWETEPPL